MFCANAQPVFAQDFSLLRESAAELRQNPSLTRSPLGVIVRHRAQSAPPEREALRRSVGDGRYSVLDAELGLELVSANIGIEPALERLRPSVAYVEPDRVVRTSGVPNDPYFFVQYGLHNTGFPIDGVPGVAGADIAAVPAWSSYVGDTNFRVAVIDTGIDYTHPDLAPNIWTNPGEIPGNAVDDDGNGYVDDVHGYDFYDLDSDPFDEHGHGTHVAGTIGAASNNGLGVAGVMWRCDLVALRFLGPQGNGSISGAILALQYCRSNGIKISNHSWGIGPLPHAAAPQSLRDAIVQAAAGGHLLVAAAGNAATDCDGPTASYPAAYDLNNVISVAATDHRDQLAGFSNYGATSVDLAAPGDRIYSTYPGGQYVRFSGTSMAAPHVTGIAAMLLARNPLWSYSQARNALLASARPVAALAGRCATGGVANLSRAFNITLPPAPSGVSVMSLSSTSALVSWTDNASDELSYRVARLDAGEDPANPAAWDNVGGNLAPNATSFVVNGLVAGQSYWFKVRCKNAFWYSAFSDVAALSHCAPSGAPSGTVAVQLGNGVVRVNWNSAGALASGYRVARLDPGEDPANDAHWDNVSSTLPAGTLQFVDTSVGGPGLYRYKLRTVNACGVYSGYSNIASVDVQCWAPATPGGLSVQWTSWRQVALSWQDLANDEVEYRVSVLDPNEDPSNFGQWDNVGGALAPNTTSYVVGGLFAGSAYRFRVRCKNACGAYSEYTAIVTGSTADLPQPTGFTADRISGAPALDVLCSWASYPSATGYHGMRVARLDPGEDPNNPNHWDNVAVVAAPQSQVVNFVPSSGTYQYKCRAYVDTPWGRVYSPYSAMNAANP